jgi:hypothetical protein
MIPHGDEVMVPKPTLKFLKDFGIDIKDKFKNGRVVRSHADSVILNFDSFEK